MDRSKLKKFLFFFDSRATFAYANNIIKCFKKRKINYKIIVSGNYLEKEMRVDEKIFKKHGLKISKKIKFDSPKYKKSNWPKSFGKAMIKYADAIDQMKPDLVIITGDRVETLSFCITCSYMNIPIAHVQAGDQSGHIDDLSRAAISKFSNLHFAPSLDACKRLTKWGENKKRIFFTGAPQLDDIKNLRSNKKNSYILIYHPVLNELDKVRDQLDNLIKAIKYLNLKITWIYPNNDSGYKIILDKIKKQNKKNIQIVSNFERSKFLELMNNSKGIIGNSSAGIIEASLLQLPVVNIGDRQKGRPQSNNIVNCKAKFTDIVKKIKFIENNKKFLKNLKKTKNPFFVKNSSEKITKILTSLNYKSSLLKKY